jgi:5-methylcytosine-specific restriction endonuclease McrA
MAERKAKLTSGSASVRCLSCYNVYAQRKVDERREQGRYNRKPKVSRPARSALTRAAMTYRKRAECITCGVIFTKFGPQTRCRPCQALSDARRRGDAFAKRSKALQVGDKTITHERVGNRDRWICQLCHQVVPRFTHCTDPASATIDHVVPISAGGLHEWDNVQLAHRGCNSARGAKPLEVFAVNHQHKRTKELFNTLAMSILRESDMSKLETLSTRYQQVSCQLRLFECQ